jgi:hypothetical protein
MTLIALDVAIGLIFVYLLIALMCSVLQEMIANLFSWRGRDLRTAIRAMLNDPTMTGLARRLYRHPRVAALSPLGKLPSYIPSATFAKALAEIIIEDNNFHPSIDGPLAPFVKAAGDNVGKLEAELALWFDDSMDRMTGWYRRNVQIVLFALGLAVAASFNVNSLEIARVLWTEPILRDAVVQNADKFLREPQDDVKQDTKQNDTKRDAKQDDAKQDGAKQDTRQEPKPDGQDRIARLETQLNSLHLPIGWDEHTYACLFRGMSCGKPPSGSAWRWAWLVQIAGWLITALAASLGAQFWFQMLNEALSLRAAGAKPPKASEKASAETGSRS